MDAVNRALPASSGSGPAEIHHPPVQVIMDDDEDDQPRAVSPPPAQFHPPHPFLVPEPGGGGGFSGGFPPSYFTSAAGTSGRGGSTTAAAGVSLATDFLPMGPSVRSRMLELHIEYRERMIHLKVGRTAFVYEADCLLKIKPV